MSQKRCTLTKKTQIYEQRSIGCIDRLNAIYHIRYPIYDMRYCHLSDIRYETKQNSNLCKSERTVKTFGFISPILAKVHPRIGKRGSKISFGGISFQDQTKKLKNNMSLNSENILTFRNSAHTSGCISRK